MYVCMYTDMTEASTAEKPLRRFDTNTCFSCMCWPETVSVRSRGCIVPCNSRKVAVSLHVLAVILCDQNLQVLNKPQLSSTGSFRRVPNLELRPSEPWRVSLASS